jgi:hypothetical protein
MALERGKLSDVVQVAAGTTASIITCASSKKVYIRSVICHQPTTDAATAQVFFVPNGGTPGIANKIFDVNVNAGETVLLEPSYPLVLDTTGESLRVGAGTSTINFIITGDKEV